VNPSRIVNQANTAGSGARGNLARRGLLVQCDRCSAKGTGRLNDRQRITSVNLSAVYSGPGRWTHRDCGGSFVAFDITAGSDGA
jgi:hypothetical protein